MMLRIVRPLLLAILLIICNPGWGGATPRVNQYRSFGAYRSSLTEVDSPSAFVPEAFLCFPCFVNGGGVTERDTTFGGAFLEERSQVLF